MFVRTDPLAPDRFLTVLLGVSVRWRPSFPVVCSKKELVGHTIGVPVPYFVYLEHVDT